MTELTWINDIDVSALSPEAQANYREYKAAYAMAKEAQVKFEQGVNDEAGLPEGKAIVFNYRFGKLSMAIGEAKVKVKPAQGKVNLAQFLASQGLTGRRA
jgi:hypothetical protein